VPDIKCLTVSHLQQKYIFFYKTHIKEESEKWGIAINLEKTKYVCIGEGK
jgi:predicted GNAT family acetyltransferase